MVGGLRDVITCAEFQIEIFMGYDFTGSRIFNFPIDFSMGLTTVQRYCAACDKSDLRSFDFVINRFFMKLFRTSNIETVSCCQEYFGFALLSTLWAKRVQKFELQFSNFIYISSCTFS